jgi:hypothetical protein
MQRNELHSQQVLPRCHTVRDSESHFTLVFNHPIDAPGGSSGVVTVFPDLEPLEAGYGGLESRRDFGTIGLLSSYGGKEEMKKAKRRTGKQA